MSFPWVKVSVGLFITLACFTLAASAGSVSIRPEATALIILSRIPLFQVENSWPSSWETILWNLRLPRITLAMLVGASLAVSGATFQGLFRNPLADPYLIGVAAGATLGATIVFLTGVPFVFKGINVLPIASFIGGTGAVAVSYGIAKKSSDSQIGTLILSGVAIGAFATATASILMLYSEPDLRPVLTWLMGSFIRAQWSHILFLLTYIAPGLTVVFIYSRILNTLQINEEYALSVGVNVNRTKLILILITTMITAAAVSFSGIIGFVGLIAPHVARLLWGNDYRILIPMAAIIGACFLVMADLVARTVVSPGELPVGIITSLCGAPFFLYLLVRSKRSIN